MDANGYIDSIIPGHDEYTCWLCGANGRGKMDRHEVFHGNAYRQKSKRYGLWVNLCHEPCHESDMHRKLDVEKDAALRQEGQRAAMQHYGWTTEEFIKIFGKNYL